MRSVSWPTSPNIRTRTAAGKGQDEDACLSLFLRHKNVPQAVKLGRAEPISCAWAGARCPWAPLGSARTMGLPVLMSASFPSLPEPAWPPPRERPSPSAAIAWPGWRDDCDVVSQTGAQPALGRGHDSKGKTPWVPLFSGSISRASPKPPSLLRPPWICPAPRLYP